MQSFRELASFPFGGYLTSLRGRGAVPWYRAGGAPAPVAAYQPIGAADLATSYVNLANPGTNNATPGVAPTFNASTGWTFNGSTQYLDTGIISGVDYSLLVRFSGVTNSGNLAGVSGGSSVHYMRPDNAAAAARWIYMNVQLEDAPAMTSGVMGIANKIAYRDGVAEVAITATAFSTPNRSWFIAGLNGGSLTSPIAANIQAFALYHAALTADQVAAVTSAMNALA